MATKRKVAGASTATATPPKKTATTPKAVFTPKRKEEEVGRKNQVYSIVKNGGIWFKLRQNNITVYDSQKDTVREIRYCENEPSIYVDEQSSNGIRSHIVFQESLLSVPKTKPNLQDYLAIHPDNTANGVRLFTIIDTESKATVELDQEFLLLDAVSIVRDKSIDELLPICMYLNIDVNQRNNEIRRELLLEAKGNPKNFIELMDNPYVRTMAAIKQAVDYNILKSKSEGMYWMDSGRLIVTTPVGQDTVTVMTRFCMTEKGSSAYEDIVRRLEKID
jgi:hypothetical protein